MLRIQRVIVAKPSNLLWECWVRWQTGVWKCGHCHHGNLGLRPRKLAACKVCGATVAYVLTG